MTIEKGIELCNKSIEYFTSKYETAENSEDPDIHVNAEHYKACIEDYSQLLSWLKELQQWRKLKSTLIPKHREGTDEYDRGANDMLEEVLERIQEIGRGDTNDNDT